VSRYTATYLIPLAPPTHHLPARTPLQLCLEIIRKFIPSSLSEPPLDVHPRSLQVRKPPEALFGQEFFRAAHKVLSGRCYPSPEFGGSDAAGKGWIDLFVPGYNFGIEYMRNGVDVKQCYSRFLEGGSYKEWLDQGQMADYIILDFRVSHPRTSHPGKFKSAPVDYLRSLPYSLREVVPRRV